MATLTFPLGFAIFADKLKESGSTFDLRDNVTSEEARSGELSISSSGQRRWYGSIAVVPQTHAGAREMEALATALQRAGASFHVYDWRYPRPAADPDLSILGASTPAIGSVGANRHHLTVSGVPNGYVLTGGDYLGYLDSQGRRRLHRVVLGDTAAASTVTVEVEPAMPVTALPGAALDLDRPVCHAVIVPRSLKVGTMSRTITNGFSFDWIQTLLP